MFKVGYSQYPIQQFIGADSAVVTSKGGLQGRFINVVFADTTAANSQRVRQYPGAMIYASGKLWVRNTTATAWNELAYNITPVNIYNSDGTLTGNRELDGDGYNLTFTAVRKFSLSGDSLDYTLDPAGNLRIGLGNQQFIMRGDTASLSRRLSYTGNLGSSFTKHSVVDKNYVDSTVSANSVNIYNSDGTLTGDRTLSGGNYELSFNNISIFDLNANNSASISQGSQYLQLMGDTGIFAKRVSYNSNLGSTFKKHTLVDKNYVDSSITASPSGTVTSVGLSMPTAFAVANSPVTSSGTLTVTGAGVASQYIRGDGQLATLPTTGGGGSSVSYYLNGSVNQGTFGGTPYYEMSKTAIFGAGTDFNISSNGYIASFITDAGDPSLLNIPAGNWDFEVYFQSSSTSGTPSFYVELYKYDGSTFTLIASSSANPEFITNGTAVDAYYTPLAVPSTSLLVTDRLAVRIYVNNSGNTITLHTEDNNLCQIITTFSTGINALNGLTSQVQYLATGTSGTDFNISSLTDTHTFNLPTASATNRGALSSADWTTFNSKIGPSDTASMLSNYVTNAGYGLLKTTKTLSVDTLLISTRAWRQKGIDSVASLANSRIGGSGTTNYVSKFTASGTIGNSQIFDNGTNVGIGTASPATKLTIFGTNPTFRVQGDGSSYYGGIEFYSSVSGSNRYNGAILQWDGNGLLIDAGTGMSLRFRPNNGTEAMRLTSAGRLLIGTSTESTYELDLVGDFRSTLDANINGLTVGKGGGAVSTNTAFGVSAINATASGTNNVAVGYSAGSVLTSGSSNVFVGTDAGRDNTTGSGNVFVGRRAGVSNVAGSNNTIAGFQAGFYTTSGGNSFYGYNAGTNVTTGGSNTYIGNGAGEFSTTAEDNSTLGLYSLRNNTTGLKNVAVGVFAGRYLSAGTNLTVATNSIFIGYDTRANADSESNQIVIGHQAIGNGSNSVTIGNSSITKTILQGNVGIGTASPSNKLHVVESTENTATGYFTGNSSPFVRVGLWGTIGMHSSTQATFIGNNAYPSNAGNQSWTRIGAAGSTVGWINIGESGMFFASGVNAATGQSRTDSKMVLFPTGNLGIGVGTTDAGYKLDVNGTARVSGTELRLDNATTGTINIYSNTPEIRFASADPTNYRFYRSGTTMYLNSAGNIRLQIAGNEAYQIDASNGHIFRSAISGGAALGRFTTGGNLIVGGTTDAGYRADIQGTFRSNYNGYGIVMTSTSGNRIQWIDNGTFRWAIASQTIQGGELANSFNFYSGTNSGTMVSIASDGAFMIGVPYPISSNYAPSAMLQVASTTKGFLPPRQTQAQRTAITSPAVGLIVYQTDATEGLYIYTSTGWVQL